MELYDEIMNPKLLVRRIAISANHVVCEGTEQKVQEYEQLNLFTDYGTQVEQKKKEEEEAAKKKAEEEKIAKTKADNCQRAKTALTTIKSGTRVATSNSKGEREIMDDKARAAEEKRLNDVIASECSTAK